MSYAVRTIFFIGVDDRFCIAICAKLVAFLEKFFTKCFIVPDLSVEDNPNISSFVGHRLMTITQIYNTKPCRTQAYRAIEVYATFIRSAMADEVCHLRHQIP